MTRLKWSFSYIFFTDPDTDWPQDYPVCGGESQSPINIDSDNATGMDYSSFSFSLGYKFVQKGPLENDGHTCMAFSYFSLPPEGSSNTSSFSEICSGRVKGGEHLWRTSEWELHPKPVPPALGEQARPRI